MHSGLACLKASNLATFTGRVDTLDPRFNSVADGGITSSAESKQPKTNWVRDRIMAKQMEMLVI